MSSLTPAPFHYLERLLTLHRSWIWRAGCTCVVNMRMQASGALVFCSKAERNAQRADGRTEREGGKTRRKKDNRVLVAKLQMGFCRRCVFIVFSSPSPPSLSLSFFLQSLPLSSTLTLTRWSFFFFFPNLISRALYCKPSSSFFSSPPRSSSSIPV